MIGLTLVTVVAVLGAGLRDSQQGAVSEQLRAGYVVDGKQQEPFSAEEGEALAKVPGVKAASHVRSETVLVGADELAVTGIDPATIARFYRFDWVKGSEQALGRLGADGAVVTKGYAEDKHLELGDSLSITTAAGEKGKAVVRGIYEPPKGKALLGDVSISKQGFDAAIRHPKNMFTFLDADDSAVAGLKAAVADYGDATYHTGAAYPKDSTQDMAMLLAMLYVLLGFSVIVSLFGMVNTLVLSVFERTRELGMLRTIGMTRRQARRMIRHESIITALIGAVLGLGLGVFLAALVTQALSSEGLTLQLPVQTLAGFTLVAVLAGIAAAILPARRASRLNVLDALHYE
jgi:putative ABC transport system permease protein